MIVPYFKVYVACQSMLIVLVGAVPEYHIEQEGIPANRAELAKHIHFVDNFTSIVTEASNSMHLTISSWDLCHGCRTCCL